VHPASGYMVASVLRTAPQLAGAVAEELGRADATPQRAARAGWNAIWDEARVRQRNLYLFGLEALLTFDGPQLRDFFTAFFKLPPERWQGYLSGTLSTGEIMRTMLAMFAHTSNRVRLPLIRHAVGSGRDLLHTFQDEVKP
jgi:lycopene beta-cyclase